MTIYKDKRVFYKLFTDVIWLRSKKGKVNITNLAFSF